MGSGRDRRYDNPASFRQALEQRLRATSKDGDDFARRRQRLVFERFLVRIDVAFGSAVILKGGLGLELRLPRARATRDVDLRLAGAPDEVLARLQALGQHDSGDFMTFEVRPDADHAILDSPGMRYDGRRFRTAAKLAGRPYGTPFGVDIVFGEPMHGEPDLVTLPDTLGFAGVAPGKLRLCPVPTHIAEKLHAYTLPRLRPNTRIKDLPDLALLASVGPLDAATLRAACASTFGWRGTHAVPTSLPTPPTSWQKPYAAMARDDRLPWSTLDELTVVVRAFMDPWLQAPLPASWNPNEWRWHAP